MTSDPFVSAAGSIILDSIEGLRSAIEGVSPDGLNWSPASADTNSLAVLTVHALGATRNWLAIALGAPIPERDRDSEFVARPESVGQLIAHLDAVAADVRELLRAAGAIDWSAKRGVEGSSATEEATAAWALVHAVEHLREHLGQAWLTRQLWEQSPGP